MLKKLAKNAKFYIFPQNMHDTQNDMGLVLEGIFRIKERIRIRRWKKDQ